MTVQEWVTFFQGVGFPAAVAFFVLYRLDGTLRDLRDEMREMRRDFRRGAIPPVEPESLSR